MKRSFFIVGPTAAGKSELAVAAAERLGGEIVSADAFQVYRGLDLLTAKPEPKLLARVPHHLVGTVPLTEQMNAQKFGCEARRVIDEVARRRNACLVVGGSGLYIKAITEGFSVRVGANEALRSEFELLRTDELVARLHRVDATAAATIDLKNRRRVVRALEIATLPPPEVTPGAADSAASTAGVFVFRDRSELHERIDTRVEAIFAAGVVDQVRGAGDTGTTASRMIGLEQIRQLIEGNLSRAECVEAIQQKTRQYAKRQLTWFRHQTNFEPLNLSLIKDQSEAVEWIVERARQTFAPAND